MSSIEYLPVVVSSNIGTNLAAANSGENPAAWHSDRETRYAPMMPSPLAPIHKSHHPPFQTTPSRKEFQATECLAPDYQVVRSRTNCGVQADAPAAGASLDPSNRGDAAGGATCSNGSTAAVRHRPCRAGEFTFTK